MVAVDGVAGLPALPAARAGAVPFHKRLPTWGLVVLWWVSLSPLLWYGMGYYATRTTPTTGARRYRILTEFTAGAIDLPHRARFWTPTRRPARRGSNGWPRRCRSCMPVVVVARRCCSGHRGAQRTVSDRLSRPTPAAPAVLPPRARALPRRLDRRARALTARLSGWLSTRPPRARRVHLVLALHDPPGLVRPVARRHEGRRHRRRACSTCSPSSGSWSARSSSPSDVALDRGAGARVDARQGPASAPSRSRRGAIDPSRGGGTADLVGVAAVRPRRWA